MTTTAQILDHLVQRYAAQVIARLPTPESDQYHADIRSQQEHQGEGRADFIELSQKLLPLAKKVQKADPDPAKQRRLMVKELGATKAWVKYLDTYVGTNDQDSKAYSWRSAATYALRDLLLDPKFTMGDALKVISDQTFKGFQAITMAKAQGPLRSIVPTELLSYLPKNVVVEVDAKGVIQKVTDRFENEHFTLGKKIEHMRSLVRDYNQIAKRVKKDLKSGNEIIKLSALVTAIMMETGIRPGKAGNGVIKTVNGEKVEIETFGAITLGPEHVRFVRNNFVELEFLGKKGGRNTATLSDGDIIKVLNDYVQKAVTQGSKFVFVTKAGVPFTYTDLQRYFRESFGELAPTDFRKLKATETVLAALRDEQASLYTRIKNFAKTAKGDLKTRIIEAIKDTFEAAITKAQGALSHDNAKTTVQAYIHPEIILRFLSTGRVDDSLESAILGGETKLAFDPKVFMQAAGLKTGGRKLTATALGDLLLDLRSDLEEAGVAKMVAATNRLASRWVQGAGTAQDIENNLDLFVRSYNAMLEMVTLFRSQGHAGDNRDIRRALNTPWVHLMNTGYKIANGILSTRSIPPRQAKGMEMVYRLLATSQRMPKDAFNWWDKNQKRLLLIIAAANKWPEKTEGGDELFSVGSFRVHNTIGAAGAELEGLKKTVAAAEKMARKNPVPGFSRVLYGDIHVVNRITQAHHAAWYHPGDDSLYLRTKTGMEEARSIVHELGHRYWAKFAGTAQKKAWVEHHRAVENNEVPRDEIHIPTVGEPFPGTKVPGVKGDPIVVKDDGANLYFEGKSRGKPTMYQIPRYKAFTILREQLKRSRNFPTAYAATSYEEHFCEALKLQAAGVLPDEHAIPFKAIWG